MQGLATMRQTAARQCHARHSSYCVAAGKGFGTPSQPSKKNSKQAKQKVLDEALKEAKQYSRGLSRPVDAKEASKGKVDFVQVKDWGSGNPEELGQLQVAGDNTTPVGQQAPAAAAAASASASSRPPSQRLLDASLFGRLAAATQSPMVMQRMRKTPEIPPYEKWKFSNARYQQYLVDTLAIHSALEDTMATIAALNPGSSSRPAGQLAAALAPLGPDLRIRRAAQLKADLQAMTAAGANAESSSNPSTSSKSRNENTGDAKPSRGATAYAQSLSQLARDWRAADGASDQAKVAGRVLAHAFLVYTSFAALATRVGAAAAEKLNLFKIGAVTAYQVYPKGVAEPLDELRAAVARVEKGLVADGSLQEVYDWAVHEMPRALEECSLLVQSVAAE